MLKCGRFNADLFGCNMLNGGLCIIVGSVGPSSQWNAVTVVCHLRLPLQVLLLEITDQLRELKRVPAATWACPICTRNPLRCGVAVDFISYSCAHDSGTRQSWVDGVIV
jgi:hypothetical protein